MLGLLQHLIPIALGFVAKLTAIKSAQNHETQKMMMAQFTAKTEQIDKARETAANESPFAAWNRRILILVILSLVAIYPLAGIFGVDTVVKTTSSGVSLLGLVEFGGGESFTTLKGLYKFDEIFQWATMIVEFYFGGQLAKPN
jgi:uncharacterized membrane protein YidH (DUF202 family)